MSRTPLVNIDEAKRIWVSLWKKRGSKPTVHEFTKALGVGSTRTAFRYLQQLDDSRTCPDCGGRGYVR